jgi:hypothetical protein
MSQIMKIDEWKSLDECEVTYTYKCIPCDQKVVMKLNGIRNFK